MTILWQTGAVCDQIKRWSVFQKICRFQLKRIYCCYEDMVLWLVLEMDRMKVVSKDGSFQPVRFDALSF